MIQSGSIQKFIIGAAYYYVTSNDSKEAILQVDYLHNTYTIEKRREQLNRAFQQDLISIAEDLLNRKHGVNFASKLRSEE